MKGQAQLDLLGFVDPADQNRGRTVRRQTNSSGPIAKVLKSCQNTKAMEYLLHYHCSCC